MKRPVLARFHSPLGYTLVEILVAMTLSLLLLGAVVRMFGNVSQGITDSRAMLESADRLRVVQARLQQDLAGVTVTMIPPRKPENNEGYFEYIEGPTGALTMTDGTNTFPLNPAINSDLATTPNRDTTVGDFDDILMFTTRSTGRPFVGRLGGTGTIQSDVAEVAWFVRGRTLYRRVFLVAPGVLSSLDINHDGILDASELGISPTNIVSFYAGYDLSVRPVWNASNTFLGYVPNTLGDLTRRECRYAHLCATAAGADAFPFSASRWCWTCSLPTGYKTAAGATWVTSVSIPTLPTLKECSSPTKPPGWPASQLFGWIAGGTQPPGTAPSSTVPTLTNTTTNPNGSLDFWTNNVAYRVADNAMTAALGMSDGLRIADDVILTNVIGFDVKAWDPQAVVIQRTDTTAGTVSLLFPDDKEYYQAYTHYGGTVTVNGHTISYDFASSGACVDVGNPWVAIAAGTFSNPKAYPGSLFAGAGSRVDRANTTNNAFLSGVYDTWSTHYESAGANGLTGPAGRGTNGFDDAGNNDNGTAESAPNGVVDDAKEAITSPPYPYPLRGIQVKIRVFEPDSRQVREVTVVQDFLPQ
jgi:type II secretory pathway component PulJ